MHETHTLPRYQFNLYYTPFSIGAGQALFEKSEVSRQGQVLTHHFYTAQLDGLHLRRDGRKEDMPNIGRFF